MASKKRKPQKLRQEFSEYANLIRTLHTTSTQDLLPHLTGSFPPPPSVPSSLHSRKHRSFSVLSQPSRSSRASSAGRGGRRHADSGSQEGGHNKKNVDGMETPKSTSSGQQDNMTRDIWTRWPLLRDSVYVPEWTLQDELRTIAERAARRWLEAYPGEAAEPEPVKLGSSSSHHSAEMNSEDGLPERPDHVNSDTVIEKDVASASPPQALINPVDNISDEVLPLPEEDMLTKGVLDGLYLDATTLLSQTFAALAAHRPAVDPGLQNRLRTMDWKSAFSVISSAGTVDQSVLQDVHTKMERIYGENDDKALGRLETRRAAKRKLHDFEESLGSRGDIFHFSHIRKARMKKSRHE